MERKSRATDTCLLHRLVSFSLARSLTRWVGYLLLNSGILISGSIRVLIWRRNRSSTIACNELVMQFFYFRQLYNKYPLYGSQVMSYWKHQWDNRRESPGKAPGNITTALDLKDPFKRTSRFTKPISEVLNVADTL